MLTEIPLEFGIAGRTPAAKQNSGITIIPKISVDSSHSARLHKQISTPKPIVSVFETGSKAANVTNPMRPPNFVQTPLNATTEGNADHNTSIPFDGAMSRPFGVAHTLDGSRPENKRLLAPHLRIK